MRTSSSHRRRSCPSSFRTMLTANGDVFVRKAEDKKLLIIDFAKPSSYALFCRIIFGLNQSTYET